MLITITARHDRDESCNDYTVTRKIALHSQPIDVPSDALIKSECVTTIALFTDTYPHRGRRVRTPFVDVTVEHGGIITQVQS